MEVVNKFLGGVFLILLVVLGVVAYNTQKPKDDMREVHIGDAIVEVEIADSEEERQRGLSHRDSLAEDEGMLFLFEQEGQWSFWMKDTRIPLDIIWARSDGTIVHIEKGVLPGSYPNVYSSDEPARFVLEVNAGFVDAHNIAEGMKIEIR